MKIMLKMIATISLLEIKIELVKIDMIKSLLVCVYANSPMECQFFTLFYR